MLRGGDDSGRAEERFTEWETTDNSGMESLRAPQVKSTTCLSSNSTVADGNKGFGARRPHQMRYYGEVRTQVSNLKSALRCWRKI